MHGKGKNVAKLLGDITELIIKTIISAYPTLLHDYLVSQPKKQSFSSCFEIFGFVFPISLPNSFLSSRFDIFLDDSLKPWLMEVNHTPSFKTDSFLDKTLKKNLIKDTLYLVYKSPPGAEYEGGLIKLFPSNCGEFTEWVESLISKTKESDIRDLFGKIKPKKAPPTIPSFFGAQKQAKPFGNILSEVSPPLIYLSTENNQVFRENQTPVAQSAAKLSNPVFKKPKFPSFIKSSGTSPKPSSNIASPFSTQPKGFWNQKKDSRLLMKQSDQSIFRSSTPMTHKRPTEKQHSLDKTAWVPKVLLTEEINSKNKKENPNPSPFALTDLLPKRARMKSELINSPVQYIRVKMADGSYVNRQIQQRKTTASHLNKPFSPVNTTLQSLDEVPKQPSKSSNQNEQMRTSTSKQAKTRTSDKSVSLKVFNFHSIETNLSEIAKKSPSIYKIKSKILKNPSKKKKTQGSRHDEEYYGIQSVYRSGIRSRKGEPKKTVYLQEYLDITNASPLNTDFSLCNKNSHKNWESPIPDITISDDDYGFEE